jgi:outer membrane protein assembly factor BamB
MRNGRACRVLVGMVLGLALLGATPARALITRLLPLSEMLEDSPFIFTATVESVDADRPALILAVDENLKGKAPFAKVPILLKGDAEAARSKQVPQLLRRVAPKLPLVLFVVQREKDFTALAYTNGTWFQLVGTATDDGPRWRFTHCEPYLRKTFKGPTADLKQTVVDALAGKKQPPKPDPKEKPGLGPEVEADRPKQSGSAGKPLSLEGRGTSRIANGPPLAVIPTVLVGGPLAILAMLFPAVFGGLMLVMRRWMVGLCVVSLNSTLYLAQGWFASRLVSSWWGTPLALWLTMSAVTLLGILWAWHRHAALLAAPPPAGAGEETTNSSPTPAGDQTDEKEHLTSSLSASSVSSVSSVVPLPSKATEVSFHTPGRIEVSVLAVLSLACLGLAVWGLPHSLAQLDLWGKTLLMFTAGLWGATLHAAYQRLVVARRPRPKPGVPGEGVLMCTMLLVGLAFSATLAEESTVPAAADDSGPYRVVWRFRPPAARSWIASSPAVEGDRVYIAAVHPSTFNPSGAVYCVERATGKLLWTFNDGGQMKDVFSSPCLAGERLYIGEGFHQHQDCKLYCLEADTGRKLWEFATASHTEATPCVVACRVYVGAGDDGLYCLDAASGKKIWHLPGLHVDARPRVAGRRLYAGSAVGYAYKETALFCLNAETGEKVWQVPTDLPVWATPAVEGDRLYVGIGNGNFMFSADQLEKPEKPAGAVLCLEAATGRRLWRCDVPDGVLARVEVDARGVYFASRDGHCYRVGPRDETVKWKTDLGSPVLASPALVEDEKGSSLYVASSGGRVCRLDPETGQAKWTFEVQQDTGQEATLFSSPVVEINGTGRTERRRIYFGCGLNNFTRGVLYCLEERRQPAE